MGKLYFTVGLPRCGKSTFSDIWAKEKPNRVHLSGDSFRLAIYAKRFQIEGEELVRATLLTATRALLMQDYDVLVDETNTSLTSIRQLFAIDSNPIVYFFNIGKSICKERALACGQDDLLPSIDRMSENLETSRDYLEKILPDYEEIFLKDVIRMERAINAKSN